jgi:hypothetical protein
MVLVPASVVTVARAVDVLRVTVSWMLVVEMLRATELVVRVLRVAGVAAAGRNGFVRIVIGEVVLGSAVVRMRSIGQ